MRNAIILCLILLGCGGGGSDDQQSMTTTTCGDFNVDVSSVDDIITVGGEEGVGGIDDLNIDLAASKDGEFIIVGCGGTYIDNDPITTTTTTITSSETDNSDDTSLIRGMLDGSITYVKLLPH